MNKAQKIFGISGWKDSGKTTLTAALVAEMTSRGLSISTVKHAHHEFDVDQPGTDSFKHRQSGAQEVMLSSSKRFALMHEIIADEDEPDLDELVAKMKPVDLILVEGFKFSDFPKLQVIRAQSRKNAGSGKIKNVIAIASDDLDSTIDSRPVYHIDDIENIADFIMDYFK
ncbi:molybdopterin-guanine dinucleotide biosynthesis protein B [Lentilitoribacter sp. Alg239-R112]|uniref:molybdopterin-guanine dinucleotide biosynthesis protein B n=1 Tax=Lentilitoribacter sp. Alg239-R112 TaxID=2305987 RepID=UPI0013A6EF67|nr:molybdopterin-guanine dinucleotide biosynthesis protein B [Lentilitoribacter sp. Alg239-R112]